MFNNLQFILIIAAIASGFLLFIGLFLSRMYRRATKEVALVRTGFGGEKVISDGGILVFPVLHQFIKVRMNTLKLNVQRSEKEALITKDRLRVDVSADFYLRVKKDKSAIANAAQTLGNLTHDKEGLKKLMEGKFVDALRAVAAVMTMDELHEKRADFVQQVQNAVTDELNKNGLELETVSLVGLDQTDMAHFNENNAFDASGLRKLTEITETKRKERNDIEQETAVQIAQKNMESEKRRLEIIQQEQIATAEQEKTVAVERARKAAEQKEDLESQRRRETEAQIKASEAIETAQIEKEKKIESETIRKQAEIEAAQIEKQKKIELAEQIKQIEIANKSKEQSAAEAGANAEKAKAREAEEKIITAVETERANREKAIAVIKANEEAEEKAVGITVAAGAEKDAAKLKADAIKTKATAEAEAIKIQAEADEKKYKVDADGKKALNAAENYLSENIINMKVQLEIIKNAASFITAAAKPIEAIEGIKIVQLGGFDSIAGGVKAGSNGTVSGGNIADDLVNGLLKYKTMSPLVESLLKEAGIDLSSTNGMANLLNSKKAELDTDTESNEDKKDVSLVDEDLVLKKNVDNIIKKDK